MNLMRFSSKTDEDDLTDIVDLSDAEYNFAFSRQNQTVE